MTDTFEQWAIVELMGHVRLAGRLTEEEHFGAKLGRIDIPIADASDPANWVTQFFSGSSIYRVTPTDEETARQIARSARPTPIYRLELTAASEKPRYDDDDEDDEDEL